MNREITMRLRMLLERTREKDSFSPIALARERNSPKVKTYRQFQPQRSICTKPNKRAASVKTKGRMKKTRRESWIRSARRLRKRTKANALIKRIKGPKTVRTALPRIRKSP